MTSERQRPIGSTGADDAADRVHASPFFDLGLDVRIVRAVEAEGYTTPTPIQARAIPFLLQGRDLLGVAQTGTGKTAAFTLPLLQHFATTEARPAARYPLALILTPTRELAIQIDESIETYGKNLRVRHAVIFGGVGQRPQVQALARGVHILTATPGRLLDLMEQGHIDLARSRSSSSTRRTGCSTWASCATCARWSAPCPLTGRRSCSRPPCPTPSRSCRARSSATRERVEVTPAATPVEKHRPEGALRREGQQAPRAQRDLHRQRRLARHRLHAHQARRQPRRRVAREARRDHAARSTATSPRALGSARWRPSPTARCGRWSPPTSRRAASTSAR
jgi:hypothetical protein